MVGFRLGAMAAPLPGVRPLVVFLALLNNMPFCVVISASQHMAQVVFGLPSIAPAFALCATAACLLGTFVNLSLVQRAVSFSDRIRGAIALQAASFIVLTAGARLPSALGASVAFLGTTALGVAQAMGEVSYLSAFKVFEPALAMWGIGTGLAGLCGPITYIALAGAGLSDAAIFAACVTLAVAYRGAHGGLLRRLVPRSGPLASRHGAWDSGGCAALGTTEPLLGSALQTAAAAAPSSAAASPSSSSSLRRARRALEHTWFIAGNLVVVYALEYEIYPGFVDVDTRRADRASRLQRSTFALAWAAYNIGVRGGGRRAGAPPCLSLCGPRARR